MTDENKLDRIKDDISLRSGDLAPSAFRFEKMAEDVQEIKVTLAKMEVTLDRNTESLVEHVARTNLLEQKVEVLKQEVTPVLKDIQPVIKYWRILSVVVVIAITASNPSLIPVILKLLGVPVP